ncbi:hypothetical protein LOK49_LG02G00754 [Camellia lanceoleosa]|uniref:Uncharacterized protein n=1 Tax=Camellia lanceoleosa TaxID=1840588 RepID=A0ACC0ITU3_9ERIC|nr:hypothetical protein LOK49_LG02G00754 [Camellia lanceoleosa]
MEASTSSEVNFQIPAIPSGDDVKSTVSGFTMFMVYCSKKMTRAHGEVIGNRIGRLVEVEASSDSLLIHRSFLRLRIEVDVTKPLLQGFILYRCDSSGPIRDGVKVYYKYEKLTKFCYACGRIGHDNLSCKFVSREEGRNSGYGPNQRTGLARSVTSLHSQNARPLEKLYVGRDKSMQPMSILLGSAAARSNRDEGVAVSGLAAPSSHNLDENVEVRSVRNRVVELGATDFFQSEVQRPCTSSSPLEPSSLLDPFSHALNLPKVNMPYSNLSVEELSSNPSPERPRPSDSLIDSSISQVFTCLSLKRPLSEEDLRDHVPLKKLKEADSDIDDVVADPKALCVFTRKPKPRALSQRGSRLKKVPLVEIPIQTAVTAVIPSPGGVVPMGVVSLADNDVAQRFLACFRTWPSERWIRLNENFAPALSSSPYSTNPNANGQPCLVTPIPDPLFNCVCI